MSNSLKEFLMVTKKVKTPHNDAKISEAKYFKLPVKFTMVALNSIEKLGKFSRISKLGVRASGMR